MALTWLDDRTLKIRFADNTTDKILLIPADNIPGLSVPCLFSGTFKGDPEAVVTVSGCKDKDTEVSMASKKIPGGLADLFVSDGKTSKVTVHYPAEGNIDGKKNRIRREARLKRSKVKLAWKKAKEIDVVFDDGTRDKIHLQAVSNIPGEVTPCLFSGALDNDQDSEVTVVGCQDDHEVVVEILSEMEADGVIELIIADGETYEVAEENTIWEGKVDDAPIPDSEEDDGLAAQLGVWDGVLPQSVTLEISLRYDLSLLAEFDNDDIKAKHYLSRVVELAKPKMALIDLRVHLKVVGSVKRFNENIRANDEWVYRIHKTENRGERGPISYFSAGNVSQSTKNLRAGKWHCFCRLGLRHPVRHPDQHQ